MYNKDLTILVMYPPAKEDENYQLPETIEEFGSYDTLNFYNCFNLKNFNISENSTEVKSVNGLL